MSIGQSLLPEFNAETAKTRKVLERVPENKFNWRVHEKSNTIGWLANHLAEIPGWVDMTVNQDELDIAPPGGEPYKSPEETKLSAVLANFDKNVATARAVLATASDATLQGTWTMLKGGNPVFTMPKTECLRTWVFSHMIHHRAIMTVYLRLNNLPVPAIYGPSGDEDGM